MPKTQKTGRPTKYSEELANKICELTSSGKPLRTICLSGDMPCRSTVNLWLSKPEYATFSDNFARAKEEYEEDRFEYLSELRERMLDGEIEPAALREAFNQIRYELGVRRPKRFGEKRTLTMDGEMTVNNTRLTPRQAADALLSAAAEDDDGFDSDGCGL